MKYALILPDGAADEPVDELEGQTPLQAADTPHMDWVAQHGRIGTVRTVPEGFTPGSDVATLSVLGYDPREYYTGRAPLEAAAQKLDVGPNDVVFRCNLTTIQDQTMVDFSAGHISQVEAETLIEDLNRVLSTESIRFYPGVMYRHLMILRNASELQVACTPPHDIPSQPIRKHLPRGSGAELLLDLMRRSGEILENHEINRLRQRSGKRPANSVWLWGHGRMPRLPRFESLHGIRGACISAVDLIRGISALIGWEILEVEGATGYIDTNYAGKGKRAALALDEHDLVAVHIEAPDEAGHEGDAPAKVRALEQIDQHIVGPVLEKLRNLGGWKILIAPDHPTPVSTKTHSASPPPFCMASSNTENADSGRFDETSAQKAGLCFEEGHRLMGHWLGTSA